MTSDWHIYNLANYDMQRTSGDTEGARSLGVPTKNWLAAWQSEGMRRTVYCVVLCHYEEQACLLLSDSAEAPKMLVKSCSHFGVQNSTSLCIPICRRMFNVPKNAYQYIKSFYLINVSFAVDLVVISEAALSRFNLKLYATVKTFRRENQNTSSRKRVRY
ncbi:hypothetical protein Pmar_PMAR019345 [Perkinsus marinus ATCC 50983]|uniref:Uncharacterized protein n=1 Tax=Perkinsus marinus (strain ATCC 50983 / TXsc) TaxID=423536 RepID=C5KFW1_PERM5|nr:hypothetical protein Pmar_PMAR019345 [Perkinsus marinus ATCC 50983]EER16663.1 hypothetical protein Pmar_PMAR019345 [Perkinsus marinus ATCC 50983]|eukprot:XP_002784867.1 hypothetical protein Pmar_PMAR019345 [Perkinsus marinus ATCC 50983]